MSHFKLCSTCRAPIAYGAKYYRCSVSTCNKKVTALYFCSVPCWDAHVPDARHRDAWAEEETAPSQESATASPVEARETTSRRVVSAREPDGTGSRSTDLDHGLPQDVLVVMSKLKSFIKAKANIRTSDGVSDPLSDHLRRVCARAIQSATTNGRGTVLARDIEAAIRNEDATE